MGWASGSRVMTDIIRAVRKVKIDRPVKVALYKQIIRALEDNDWDTQDECLELDDCFDEAMKELHPTWFEHEDEDEE